MLVNATNMLLKARDGHYAVGQFNINNLEWTKSILLTAQEMNSPVILGVSEGAGKYMTGFKTVAAMVRAMDESLGITVPAVSYTHLPQRPPPARAFSMRSPWWRSSHSMSRYARNRKGSILRLSSKACSMVCRMMCSM